MDTVDNAFIFIVTAIFGVACFFGGHETARIIHGMDREIINLKNNKKLQACHSLLVGELYAKGNE